MKTYSRRRWERQYEYLAAINPLIKILLPFDKVLLSDLDSIKDDILAATSARIQYTGGFNFDIPSSELQKVVLTELNDYGHSLVLLSDDKFFGGASLKDEVLDEILHCNRDVNLNVEGANYYVRMQSVNSVVVFGSHTFQCKHVSIIYDDGNIEVYLPIEGTRRLFVASHSTPCSKCENKGCINRIRNGEIRLYDSFTDSVIMTPSKPYDMHNVACTVYDKAIAAMQQLGNALMIYNAIKKQNSSSGYKRQTSRSGGCAHAAEGSSIRIVSHSVGNPNEVFIPVSKPASVYEYKGGTHASPVAHSVSGYWRRRSKNDSTMIFVKSFARGGSKSDREKITVGIQKKQTVYKVDGFSEVRRINKDEEN